MNKSISDGHIKRQKEHSKALRNADLLSVSTAAKGDISAAKEKMYVIKDAQKRYND